MQRSPDSDCGGNPGPVGWPTGAARVRVLAGSECGAAWPSVWGQRSETATALPRVKALTYSYDAGVGTDRIHYKKAQIIEKTLIFNQFLFTGTSANEIK